MYNFRVINNFKIIILNYNILVTLHVEESDRQWNHLTCMLTISEIDYLMI